MGDSGKVSGWVEKAVYQIAAFGGDTRKIDKNNADEVKALSGLLAQNLEEPDREFVEGFMLEKGASKAPKVNGKDPEINRERRVDLPYQGVLGANSPEEMEIAKKMHNMTSLFFDENGEVIKYEIIAEDGSKTLVNDLEILEDGKVKLFTTQKTTQGSTIVTTSVGYPGFDQKDSWEILDMVETLEDGTVQHEMHTFADGQKITKNINTNTGERYEVKSNPDGSGIRKVFDKEGNLISSTSWKQVGDNEKEFTEIKFNKDGTRDIETWTVEDAETATTITRTTPKEEKTYTSWKQILEERYPDWRNHFPSFKDAIRALKEAQAKDKDGIIDEKKLLKVKMDTALPSDIKFPEKLGDCPRVD